jgi:hypothetical protein
MSKQVDDISKRWENKCVQPFTMAKHFSGRGKEVAKTDVRIPNKGPKLF